MTRSKLLRWALGLSLPLLALGIWRHQVAKRNEAEAELFHSYEEGSLNDYVFSVSRSYELLRDGKGETPSKIEEAAARSASELEALLKDSKPGWIQERLAFALPLQRRWAENLKEFPKAKEKGAWLKDEGELRGQLLYMLEDVRYHAFHNWKQSQDEFLELNALIYSLKHPDED